MSRLFRWQPKFSTPIITLSLSHVNNLFICFSYMLVLCTIPQYIEIIIRWK
jgi:hypothetical protein